MRGQFAAALLWRCDSGVCRHLAMTHDITAQHIYQISRSDMAWQQRLYHVSKRKNILWQQAASASKYLIKSETGLNNKTAEKQQRLYSKVVVILK